MSDKPPKGLERWRGSVDEKLRNIESGINNISSKCDNIFGVLSTHEADIKLVKNSVGDCEIWQANHSKAHQENKKEAKEMSLRKISLIVSILAGLGGAIGAILLRALLLALHIPY